MRSLFVLVCLFLAACSTNQKDERFYIVDAEVFENGKRKATSKIAVNETEEASVFMHDENVDQLLEVQVEGVKNGAYIMTATYCSDVSKLTNEDFVDLGTCSESNMNIKGNLDEEAIIEIKEKDIKRKFKFRVSEKKQKALLNKF